MSRKQKGKGASRFLTPRNALADFAANANLAILSALDKIGRKYNRLIALGGLSSTEDDDRAYVMVNLTDGALALFPFIDAETAAASDQKYFEKMSLLREKYGDDLNAWPKQRELAPELNGGYRLGFAFYIDRLRAREVSFMFSITLFHAEEEKEILLKSQLDVDIDLDDEEIVTIRNEPDVFGFYFRRLVGYWLFNPEVAWETAPMREMISLFGEVAIKTWAVTPEWGINRIRTFGIGDSALFRINGVNGLQAMKDSPLKDQCREIVGDWFKPGLPAALLLDGKVHSDGSLDVSLKGPVTLNQRQIRYDHELLDLFKETGTIYSRSLAPAGETEDSDDMVLELTGEILEVLGIERQKASDDDYDDYDDDEAEE